MKELESKNIVVVGASSGLGKALVCEASERGASVFALARGIEFADLPEGIRKIKCDATLPNSVGDAFREIEDQAERIDTVIISLGLGLVKSFADTTDEEISNMVDTNTKAPLFVAKKAFEVMKKQKGGHIVTISSTTGLEGKANEVVYSASKQGLRGMNQALAKEGADIGIEATCVFPGGIKSENFWNQAKPDLDISNFMDPNQVAVKIVDMLEKSEHPLELVLRRQ